jgi:hypothetical protein
VFGFYGTEIISFYQYISLSDMIVLLLTYFQSLEACPLKHIWYQDVHRKNMLKKLATLILFLLDYGIASLQKPKSEEKKKSSAL